MIYGLQNPIRNNQQNINTLLRQKQSNHQDYKNEGQYPNIKNIENQEFQQVNNKNYVLKAVQSNKYLQLPSTLLEHPSSTRLSNFQQFDDYNNSYKKPTSQISSIKLAPLNMQTLDANQQNIQSNYILDQKFQRNSSLEPYLKQLTPLRNLSKYNPYQSIDNSVDYSSPISHSVEVGKKYKNIFAEKQNSIDKDFYLPDIEKNPQNKPRNLQILKNHVQQNQIIINSMVNEYQQQKKKEEELQEAKLKKKLLILQNQQIHMENQFQENVKQIMAKDEKNKKRFGEEGVKIGENQYITKIRHPVSCQQLEIVVRYDKNGKRIPPPMVILPNHLKPNPKKQIISKDGLNPSVFQAQHKQMYSALKTNNKKKLEEIEKRQLADTPEFLQGLFEADYSDKVNNENLEVLQKEFINQNKDVITQQIQKKHNIPIVKDNPKSLKENLLEQNRLELENYKSEQMKKKLLQKEKFKQMAKKAKNFIVIKGSMQYLKRVVTSLIAFNSLFKDVVNQNIQKRKEACNFLDSFIQVYNKVAISWVEKSLQKVIQSLYPRGSRFGQQAFTKRDNQDVEELFDASKQSLKFFKNGISKQEFWRRIMFLKIRIKGILESLIEFTNVFDFPKPLLLFFGNILKESQYIPDGFLTPYELNRLNYDNYGRMVQLDYFQRSMIATKYIYGKIMIKKVFLQQFNERKKKQIKDEFSQQQIDLISENFKIISSILYIFMNQLIQETMKQYEREQDTLNNDIISKSLYDFNQMQQFFQVNKEQLNFSEDMKRNLRIWIQKLSFLVESSINEEQKKVKF